MITKTFCSHRRSEWFWKQNTNTDHSVLIGMINRVLSIYKGKTCVSYLSYRDDLWIGLWSVCFRLWWFSGLNWYQLMLFTIKHLITLLILPFVYSVLISKLLFELWCLSFRLRLRKTFPVIRFRWTDISNSRIQALL